MKKKDWFTLCDFCRVHQDSPLVFYIIISYCKNKTWPLQKIWEIQKNRRKVNCSTFTAPGNNCCYIVVDLSSPHFCFIKKKQKQNCHCTGMRKSVLFFLLAERGLLQVWARRIGAVGGRGWLVLQKPPTPWRVLQSLFFFNCRIIAL